MGKKGTRDKSKHRKKSKRSRSSESSNETSKKRKREESETSSDSSDGEKIRKLKKMMKKLQKKESRRSKKLAKIKEKNKDTSESNVDELKDSGVDIALMQKSKTMAPMTKDEWERKQNTVRRVFDEQSGRSRLVRGDGEIVEECVSRERHLAINKQATQGDGQYFQNVIQTCVKQNSS